MLLAPPNLPSVQRDEIVRSLLDDPDRTWRATRNLDLQNTLTSISPNLNELYEFAGLYLVAPEAFTSSGWLMPNPSVGAMPQELFLRSIEAIETQKGIQAAMVATYDYIGDLFVSGDMNACDLILREIKPERMNPDLILSVLTATAAASRNQLPNRHGLYKQAYNRFKREMGPEEADQLLRNLE